MIHAINKAAIHSCTLIFVLNHISQYNNTLLCLSLSGLQARSKDQEILEEGGGAGPSLLPRRDHA